MNDWKNKIIAEILAGTLLATFLAVPGAIVGMQIGGNYGCLSFINSIFGTFSDYESCGFFGVLLGLIVGAVLGVLLLGRLVIKNYRRVIMIFGLIIIMIFVFDILSRTIGNGEDSMKERFMSLLDFVSYAWYLVISSFKSILILLLPLSISLIITLLFNLVQYLLVYFHIQKQY